MIYRAVGGRIALKYAALGLHIPKERAFRILERLEFEILPVDITGTARSLMGRSSYRRGARMHQAPEVVDCSSFVKWVYGMAGIWLPRRSIQQRAVGQEVLPDRRKAGDLVFATGKRNYYVSDPADGVGHVAIATECGTVLHAAGRGVIETDAASLLGQRFRGARRIIPLDADGVVTLRYPPSFEVETGDDIRWIILQNL